MHKVSQHNETDLIVGRIIYPCDICDYVAGSKVNLRIHIETKHRKNSSQYNKTPTMCDQCDHIASCKGVIDFLIIIDNYQGGRKL